MTQSTEEQFVRRLCAALKEAAMVATITPQDVGRVNARMRAGDVAGAQRLYDRALVRAAAREIEGWLDQNKRSNG